MAGDVWYESDENATPAHETKTLGDIRGRYIYIIDIDIDRILPTLA
jgi:hypothetical protein